jgi:membrane protein
VKESWEDEVFGQAARLAFYHFLALFPALLLAATILGRFSGTGSDLLKTLESLLGSILPARAFEMVTGFFAEISKGAARHTVWFAMFGSLWAALNGTWAVMSGLNAAYEVAEQRSWWQVTLTGAGLTIALAVLGFISLVLLFYSRKMEAAIMQRAGVSNSVSAVWQVAQWPILAAMLLIAFALVYHFGPNLSDRKMRWSMPGAVIAVILWLCTSGLFRGYMTYQASKYDQAYGSAGALAILLLWFYFTGAAILIGGEANSEIENAARSRMPPRSTVTRMRAAPEIAVMAGFPQNAFESTTDSCERGLNACCDRLVCYPIRPRRQSRRQPRFRPASGRAPERWPDMSD